MDFIKFEFNFNYLDLKFFLVHYMIKQQIKEGYHLMLPNDFNSKLSLLFDHLKTISFLFHFSEPLLFMKLSQSFNIFHCHYHFFLCFHLYFL